MFRRLHTGKLKFYFVNYGRYLIPKKIYEIRLNSKLRNINFYDEAYINKRVSTYIKLSKTFSLKNALTFTSLKRSTPIIYGNFFRKKQLSAPYFDIKKYLYFFPKHSTFKFIPVDAPKVQSEPTFVKSRPITCNNENSVLFPLDRIRLFSIIKDDLNFKEKKNIAIFRGACHQKHRQNFMSKCYNLPNTDIGDTRKSETGKRFHVY